MKRPKWLTGKKVAVILGFTIITGFVIDTVHTINLKNEARTVVDSVIVERDSLVHELKTVEEMVVSRRDTHVVVIPYSDNQKGAAIKLSKKDLNQIAEIVVQKIKEDSSLYPKNYVIPEFIVSISNDTRK